MVRPAACAAAIVDSFNSIVDKGRKSVCRNDCRRRLCRQCGWTASTSVSMRARLSRSDFTSSIISPNTAALLPSPSISCSI